MGITGLIPFLEKSSKKTNISEFSGGTVAIDTYCWLHKGAFSCADKIIMGQATDAYVKYCMKFVNMLLGHNIKPILVFDGRHLPAKAETEIKRRETRESNRKRAAELIKMGNIHEGKNLLRRSLDVSHKMALEVIKECQAHNVDCIVAPYEADAQLAYLSISGIADVVITEDSDLTLFGCKKIFFKMDMYGHGLLVEQDRLHLAMGLNISNFHMDKFRYMCILSGCDYLASLPGIGLGKACKFIVKNTDDNIYNALQRLASSLNMKTLTVTKEYRDGFMRALATFKHQLVYCPLQRKQLRLNPPTADITDEQLKHAGSEVDAQLAWQLALGNCDPFTYDKLHSFDPDNRLLRRSNSWSETTVAKHISIWSKNFSIKNITDNKSNVVPKKEKLLPTRTSTRGQVTIMDTILLKKEITPKKRIYEESEMSVDEIVQMYKKQEPKPVEVPVPSILKVESENNSSDDEKSSPVLVKRSNPFRKVDGVNETSPSLLHRVRKRLPVKSRLKATVIDDTAIVQSKFFTCESKSDGNDDEPMDIAESMVTNVTVEDSKENLNISQKIIIPETVVDEEEFSNVEEDINTHKRLCIEREVRNDSETRQEPLKSVDINSVNASENNNAILNNHLTEEENENLSTNKEMEFSITREVFSEHVSSLFKYESPSSDRRLKKDFSQNSQRNFYLSQATSSRRSSRSNVKKTTTIQGQQSLLNMFGFQKKNALKH